MVAFYLDNTFFYDPKIFTWENICHQVEQMILSDIFFGWQKTEKLPALVAKK